MTAAPDVACRTSFTSTTVESSRDLRSSLDVSAHVSGGGFGVSFSASTGYKKASSTVESGKFKLILSTANCKYYFAKLNEFDLPEFSFEMMEWLKRMNSTIARTGTVDDNLLYDFLEYFGTHYASEMVYGASFTYENRITSSSYESMKSSEFSVEVQASYSGLFSVGGGFGMSKSKQESAKKFQENSVTSTISIGAPPPYNGDAMTWASTVKDTPVPVDYKLKPIHELFDNQRPAINRYFSADKVKIIKNRIIDISARYCRMMGSKGANVQCHDDSVIKINDYALKSPPSNGSSVNLTVDACIDECLKRKSCNIASFHAGTFAKSDASVEYTCIIDNHHTPREELVLFQNSTTFIDPESIRGHLGLVGLRYALTVPRVNEMEILGSNNFDILNDFCAMACSVDDRCIGFEASVRTYYKYNCAMYREHSEELIKTGIQDFETYIMPNLAKTNFRSEMLPRAILLVNVSMKSSSLDTTTGCDFLCCERKCRMNNECLAYSTFNSTCLIHTNSATGESSELNFLSDAVTKIYIERAQSGWLNFTTSQPGLEKDSMVNDAIIPHSFCENDCAKNPNAKCVVGCLAEVGHPVPSPINSPDLKLERMNASTSFDLIQMNAEYCAGLCAKDVSCLVSSWNHSCVFVNKLQSNPGQSLLTLSEIVTTGNHVSKIMIPNYREKVKRFRLNN